MAINIEEQDVNKFILIGERVLIKPRSNQDKTKSGLYLPPGIQEKEKVHSGYVIKPGPGYPIPAVIDEDEPWKGEEEDVRYVPLQAEEGDLAIYMQNAGNEIVFKDERYVIVPHSAILMLIRDYDLFE
jgi:co-chaperonin GroES (HSP10)